MSDAANGRPVVNQPKIVVIAGPNGVVVMKEGKIVRITADELRAQGVR